MHIFNPVGTPSGDMNLSSKLGLEPPPVRWYSPPSISLSPASWLVAARRVPSSTSIARHYDRESEKRRGGHGVRRRGPWCGIVLISFKLTAHYCRRYRVTWGYLAVVTMGNATGTVCCALVLGSVFDSPLYCQSCFCIFIRTAWASSHPPSCIVQSLNNLHSTSASSSRFPTLVFQVPKGQSRSVVDPRMHEGRGPRI
jgi:hypothetical protein